MNESAPTWCLFCGAPLEAADDTAPRWRVFGVPSPFVGRTDELDLALQTVRHAVTTRTPVLGLVVGPEGAGKTRFLDALRDAIADEFPQAVFGRGSGSEGLDQPYGPLAQLLASRFDVAPGTTPRKFADRLDDGIRSVVDPKHADEVADGMAALLGLPRAPQSRTGTESERARRRALVALLRADADRRPVIFVLDDFDQAGVETRSLLGAVLTELADSPVIVLASAEDGGVRRDAVRGDDVTTVEIVLRPLSDDDVTALSREVLARVDNLDAALLARIASVAAGNPLVAEEAIRALIRGGVIDTRGDRWTENADRLGAATLPDGVDAMVRTRLAALDDEDRRLLGDAALVGHTFWLGALVVVERARTGAPADLDAIDGDDDRARIATRLDRLVRRDLVRRTPGTVIADEPQFTFRHSVERRLHAEAVDASWRPRAHQSVAQWLRAASVGREDAFLGVIADHYAAGGMEAAASQFYAAAGRSCRARHVNDRAIAYLRRAIALCDANDHFARADLLHNLGDLLALTGAQDEALRTFGDAARDAWMVDSPRRLAAALGGLGRAHLARAEYDRAIAVLRKALARFETMRDRAGIAQTLDDLGRIHWIRGQYDRAEQEYVRALDLRRELGDKRALAVSLSHIGTLLAHRGQFNGALERFREALEIRRREGDLQGIAESLNTIGYIFAERGEAQAAVRVWTEAIDVAREVGDRSLEAALLNNLGESTLAIDDVAGAEAHLRAACELAEEIGDRRVVFDAVRNLGVVQAHKGNLSLALDHAEEALDLAKSMKSRVMEGIALRTIGELHGQAASRGPDESRSALAEAAFRSAIELFRELGNENELGRTYHSYGSFLVEQRLLVQGKKHLEMAREIFQRLEMRKILAQTEATILDL